MIFDKAWFERHQLKVLIFLNLPLVGQVLRRAMWIPELWRPITHITPDAVHVWVGRGRRRATLYSNPQYAEGLHRSFGWLWALVHSWDMQVANRWVPALNMGLDAYISQPNETSGKDTYISTAFPTTNFDSEDFMGTGDRNDVSEIWRSLIQFDFSTIPSGAISSARTLSLWVRSDLSSNNRTVRFYRCKRAWVESQATWNVFSTGNNWATSGASGTADRDATDTLAKTVSASAVGEQQWTTGDNPALMDEMFGATPTFANNGFVIQADTEADDAFLWNTSRYATEAQRPKLVIAYLIPGGWWNIF